MTPQAEAHPGCSYCGLPLPRCWWSHDEQRDADQPAFCCVGCRIASSVTQSRGAEGQARWMLTRLGLAIFFTMNVMVFAMALWSRDIYLAGQETSELADTLWQLFRYLGLLFSLPVLLLLGVPIVENTWDTLRRGVLTTDLLILLGVAAAYVYSIVSIISGDGHVYFEVACMVLVMVTLGRWLEARGKLRASQALDALSRLLPQRVRVIRNGQPQLVDRAAVAVAEHVRVTAGERFAVDGRIVEGAAEIDQQLITGESETVARGPGDAVYSGTLNTDGDVVVQVTAAAGAETVSRLIELVQAAREAKGRYQRLADRVAQWFVPAVSLLAIVVTWLHTSQTGLEEGILAGLAVVLIACPCALGLATPLAVWTALGRAAQQQVLFGSGAALERLAAIQAVRFDKTGTLTTGQPVVDNLTVDDGEQADELLALAAGLASASTHSLAGAVSGYARAACHGLDVFAPSDVKSVAGRGVSGQCQQTGSRVWLGSEAYVRQAGLQISTGLQRAVQEAHTAGRSLVCIGWDGRVRGVFRFREQLRPEAASAIAACRKLELDAAVLTGDHDHRGAALAEQLQVPVSAELLPQQKLAAIDHAAGRLGPVAMVGDGLNDAPALAAAHVGIAMGCGADMTRDCADVCLLSNDLSRVAWSVKLARRCVHVIRQNLFWAFAYNAVGMALAASGRLNPIWAAAAMALSSFFVVSNSMRLAAEPDDSYLTDESAADRPAAAHGGTEYEPLENSLRDTKILEAPVA
ncbi:MAG: cation-translocating P-type ATPase [Planctomycetota bacterium]|nr:cation-translocating P-type ATPase [Planctomycetota bacterium]